jgi:hypothetical protein
VTEVRDTTSMTDGWRSDRDVAPFADRSVERAAWLRAIVAQVVCLAAIAVANILALTVGEFHWWANFVLVPGSVVAAAGLGLRDAGPAGRSVIGWLGAIVFTTGVLLLTGTMGALWPLMIVVPCLGPVALVALRPADASVRAMVDTVAGLGAVAVALGATFLALRADLVEFGSTRWWVWFMVAAATVPGVNGLLLLNRRRGGFWFSTAVLLLAAAGFTFVAAMREWAR